VSRGLADTSVFIARESGRTLDAAALPDELAVSIVTIGELLRVSSPRRRWRPGIVGCARLTTALELAPVPVDHAVASQWARLRVLSRDSLQRMPVNDSWIAATAMALEVPIVTRDDDFPIVEGLSVTRV
jgi:predicted nucleic acid-binding protein